MHELKASAVAQPGSLSEPVTILLRAGRYYLDEPPVLKAEDSDSPATPIAYRAYPGEHPILSSGNGVG